MRKIILVLFMVISLSPLSWAREKQVKADIRYVNLSAGYMLVSDSGEKIVIGILYSEKKRKSEILNVVFTVPESTKDKKKIYTFSTKKGKVIITYFFNEGEIENVKVDTDYQPKRSSASQRMKFTLVSAGGYKIFFDFVWKNKELSVVKVYPSTHPFAEYK